MTKISVVIPVFNDPRIHLAIESVNCQRFAGEAEIIVIDGGSTDTTPEVLEAYRNDLSIMISESDNGVFDALNKGTRLATGDVIALMGADDRFATPDVFALAEKALRDTTVDGCYGDLVYVNDADQVVRYWRSGNYSPLKIRLGWIVPHFTLFLRKSVYERVGLLDTRYRVAADYDFFLRLFLQHHVQLAYIPQVLLRMTLGGVSNRSLRATWQGVKETTQAWKRNGFHGGQLAPVLKPLGKLPQYIMKP